jgi:ribosomal RNA-processing protein 36
MAPVAASRRKTPNRDVESDGSVAEGSSDSINERDRGDNDSQNGSSSSGDGVGYDEENETGEGDEEVEQRIHNVSFGALKQAQDALSRKRKRGSDSTADQEEKLEALRARLDQIRSKSKKSANAKSSIRNVDERQKDRRGSSTMQPHPKAADTDSEPDSDSAPSEEDIPTKSRTSKHAPASQSSRHQVTRKRTVVDVPKRTYRDPRFDALQERSAHPGNSGKAYSFLRDYQKDEIAELKAAIKLTRNEDDKETLKRKVISMQNKIKSEEAKEREQEVLRQHRREEREKVEQGTKPFYLKQKDVKERAMVEKFKGMKSKDREKLMEKRRRKEDQKEKRRMPEARRLNE